MITEVLEFRDHKPWRCEDAFSQVLCFLIQNSRAHQKSMTWEVIFLKLSTSFSLCREATPSTSAVCDTLGHDTVGAVALDRSGSTAAATSTGGITAKRPGRVGDSPIVGKNHHKSSQANPTSILFYSSILTFRGNTGFVDMFSGFINNYTLAYIYINFCAFSTKIFTIKYRSNACNSVHILGRIRLF